MSKGLEALDNLVKDICFNKNIIHKHPSLTELKNTKEYKTIEKELKALDFIRTWLKDDFFVYFKLEEDSICIDGSSYLPKEEYELLKEVLK